MDGDSSPSSHSTSSSESRSKSTENVDGYGDDPGEDDSEGDDADTTAGRRRRKRRKGRRRSEKLYVDMYKVFDGSAMMALGDHYEIPFFFLIRTHLIFQECLCRSISLVSWNRPSPKVGKKRYVLPILIHGVTLRSSQVMVQQARLRQKVAGNHRELSKL
jgi:hypothetical protein